MNGEKLKTLLQDVGSGKRSPKEVMADLVKIVTAMDVELDKAGSAIEDLQAVATKPTESAIEPTRRY